MASALFVWAACGSDATGTDEPPPASRPTFEVALVDPAGVAQIVPPGSISGDEIKGHAFVRFSPASIDVVAPVDMTLTRATWVGASDDYGLEFEINSRFRLRLGHIDAPRADIAALVPRTDPSSILVEVGPVLVRAGESIGRAEQGGADPVLGFDFGVYDLDAEGVGPNAERYRQTSDYTKLGSVCGFELFEASIRGSYAARFASIGGVPVPGAPCRSIDDVVARGGVAGEWFLTSHPPDATYSERFAVGLDLSGTIVRVAGIAGSIDAAVAIDPQDVVGEVCYQASGRFVFLRPTSSSTADVVAGGGACPAVFPAGEHRSYRR